MPRETEQIGCALIGYGAAHNMGQHHGSQINEVPGLKVRAACDVDATRLEVAQKDFPGLEAYTQVDDLLESDQVDLCVIILPHNLHGAVGLQCLQAGRHVVLEKPMCITTDEAQAMIEAAQANEVVLTVYHNRRHDGDFKALKAAVEEGLVGEVFQVEMWGGGYGAPFGSWRDDKKFSGGTFYDWGAHYLDWLQHILPEKIVSVTGFFHKRVWAEKTNEDHVQAVIRYQSGATANVQMSTMAHHSLPRWRVLGTEGALVSTAGGFDYYTQHKGVPVKGFLPDQESTWQDYYPALGAHLLKGAELAVKPEEAARVIAIMEAAEKSSQSGQAEPLPGWL